MAEKVKININSIAKMAGVSATTVSNFINFTEKFPISAEKQSSIKGIMKKYNYRINSSSSMIRRNKKLPEKVVFFYGNSVQEKVYDVVQNPMLKQLLLVLSNALLAKFGLFFEVRSLVNEHSRDEWNEVLLDAAFVINYGQLNPILNKLTQRKNIPFIVVAETESALDYADFEEEVDADTVYWETRSHPSMLLDYLYSKGVRKSIFVSSWNVCSNRSDFFAIEAQAKIDSVNDYIHSHADMENKILTPPMPENIDIYYEIRNTCQYLLRSPEVFDNIDVVLAHNDIVAQGVIAAMHQLGIIPGKDILLTGDGHFPEYKYSIPSVTTITYDSEILAREICKSVERFVNGDRAGNSRQKIPSILIINETA